MELTRRQFVQVTGAAAAGVAFSGLGSDLTPVMAHAKELKTKAAKETTTICPYCAVGCGAIVSTSQKEGRVINIEGDPDHVINRGALCSKGSSLRQLVENKQRLTRPRSPRSAAQRSTTRSAGPTRPCCVQWGWSTSSIRLVSDTARL